MCSVNNNSQRSDEAVLHRVQSCCHNTICYNFEMFLNLCHKTITRVCKKCSLAERISILQSDNMPTVRKKFSKTVRIIRMDGKYRSWR